MSTNTDWLTTLHVGSEVAIPYGMHGIRFCTIERETAMYWVVGGCKYRKDSGRIATADRWNVLYLREPTEALKSEVHEQKVRHKAIAALSSCRWREMSTNQLTRMADIARESEAEDTPAKPL